MREMRVGDERKNADNGGQKKGLLLLILDLMRTPLFPSLIQNNSNRKKPRSIYSQFHAGKPVPPPPVAKWVLTPPPIWGPRPKKGKGLIYRFHAFSLLRPTFSPPDSIAKW